MAMTRAFALTALLVTFAVPLRAQSGNGYLFGAPAFEVNVHAGYARAIAQSDVFDDAIRFLTLERGDFSGPSIGGELAIAISPRFALALNVDYASAVRRSEDRKYQDNNNLPIEQTTSFRRVPVTANAKLYLAPRGRSVGSLAWIPAKVVPWLGAGGGAMWYRLQQDGDFVDYQTLNVFAARLESSGWAPAFNGIGGVDVTLTPRVAFTADARYTWAKATPSRDYSNFDKIDLSGVTAALGFTIRL